MNAGPPSGRPGTGVIARAEAALRAERETVLQDLGHDAVLWLALTPLWTKRAAESVGFPASSLIDFIQRARKAGWCETRGSLRDGGAPNLRFWMPGHLRGDVLDSMRRHTGAAAREIAARILRSMSPHQGFSNTFSPQDPAMIPAALEAWAGLLNSGAASRQLVDSVSQAVESGDLGRAQDLISAGEALVPLLSGPMELAVDRARRLLSLGRRRRMDAADLERYLDRPELSGAVDRLLTGDPGQWALHLRGVGGVGKTMLIKYLASGRYAADRSQDPIPVARVDFDYLSPDFPVRRPVELLLELADELALHTATDGVADRWMRRFRATAASVHESFSSARAPHPAVMRDERVLAAIDDFAAALNALPQALLILDTCEELAKLDAGDPAAPSVTTTFQILERIHDRAPNVRVLFAGRRPLPPHDYLAVQPVSGFTEDEARRYLTAFADEVLSEELAAAILRQSPAVDDPDRISPFDLALYRSWAEEDPDLTTDQVAQGSDAYIEGRIIQRLSADEGDVFRALPALATAGRCRVATLAEFLDVAAEDLGKRLAAQEWIDADGDPPVHVAAKPALAARLRRYFDAPDRVTAFGRETARLAGLLRHRVAEATVGGTDIDEVLAALRLSAPADAATLWDDLAVRAKDAREWDWLRIVADRLRGEWEEEDWPTTAALRATVTAAHIAASRRAYPSFDAQAAWTEVLDSWQDHPDRDRGLVLRARAQAGLGQPQSERVHDPEVKAALVDAVHQLLEDSQDNAADQALKAVVRPMQAVAVMVWSRVAMARLKADSRPESAKAWLRESEYYAERIRDLGTEYFDWIQPDDLLARVRIEWGLITPPDEEKLAEWESYAENHFDTIDAERLASQCLRIRLSRGVVDRLLIERWERIDRYEHAWQPTCSAHDLVPPLFVTIAQTWLAAGEPQRALDLLDRRREAALATRSDDVSIRHADLETIRIARRLRLADQRALLTRLAERGDREAQEAVAVIFGDAVPRPDSAPPRDWLLPKRVLSSSRVRSPDPYWEARAAMHQAARADEEYDPPSGMPLRLFAEMAFDEAELELLSPSGPDPAARLFGYARDAYLACNDPIGDVLSLVSIVDITPRDLAARRALERAIERLHTRNPDVARALTGPLDRAGPWRHWAAKLSSLPVRAVAESAPEQTVKPDFRQPSAEAKAVPSPPQPVFSAAQPAQSRQHSVPSPPVWARSEPAPRALAGRGCGIGLGLAVALVVVLGGLLVMTSPGTGSRPAPSPTPTPSIAPSPGAGSQPGGLPLAAILGIVCGVVAIAVLVLLVAWARPRMRRLADGRGVGAVHLARLSLEAVPERTGRDREGGIRLWAGRERPPTGPDRTSPGGYRGRWRASPGEPARVVWDVDERPDASDRWWRRGTASGAIVLDHVDASLPWERMLAESFGPRAAGRVAWHREMRDPAAVASFATPERWVGHYVGQAVSTAAGPRLDTGKSASEGLLGVTELAQGTPALIVLQADRVADTVEALAGDDHLEKLELAVELINAGAAPAVLIVPAVPVGHGTAVTSVIDDYQAKRRKDPRALQAELRKILAPQMPSALLDDIVLFVNEGSRRE